VLNVVNFCVFLIVLLGVEAVALVPQRTLAENDYGRVDRSTVLVESGIIHGTGVVVANAGKDSIIVTASHVIGDPNSIYVSSPISAGGWNGIATMVQLISRDPRLDVALLRLPNFALTPICLGSAAIDATDISVVTYSQDALSESQPQLRLLHYRERVTSGVQHSERVFYFDGAAIEGYSGSPVFEPSSTLLVGIEIAKSTTAEVERKAVDVSAFLAFYNKAKTANGYLPNLPIVQNGADVPYPMTAARHGTSQLVVNVEPPMSDTGFGQRAFTHLTKQVGDLLQRTSAVVYGANTFGPQGELNVLCATHNAPGMVIVNLARVSPLREKEFTADGMIRLVRCLDRGGNQRRVAYAGTEMPSAAPFHVAISGLPGSSLNSWADAVARSVVSSLKPVLDAQFRKDDSAWRNFGFAGVPFPDAADPPGRNFCQEYALHGA
jgi:hypothetical protein